MNSAPRTPVPTAGANSQFAMVCIALPWLNPFAIGPSPAAMPWLVALAATAGLVLIMARGSSTSEGATETANPDQVVLAAAGAWLLAGVVSSCIGLLQYFGVADALGPWVSQTQIGEAFANLRQRNQFASLMNIALASLIWWAVSSIGKVDTDLPTNQRRLAWASLTAVVLAVGNAASSSRTGLVQLLLLSLLCQVWGLWRLGPVRRLLQVTVVVYGVATLALPWVAGLDLSLHGLGARLRAGDEACSSRLTLWSNVLHLIAQKPWLGWGWGELDYAHYTTLYKGPRFCEILDNAHNLPLQLAVEMGSPVALLVSGGFVWWVARRRPWRETDPSRQLAWSVLAVILLHSLLEYPLWYGPFQMAILLCAVILWPSQETPSGKAGTQKSKSESVLGSASRLLTAIVLLAATAYAVWDYQRISQIYLAPAARDAAYRDDTLGKIRDSWLFTDQVRFAELLLTPLARDNALWTFTTAMSLLHYSPEPRVIEKIIESAVMLGRDDDAMAHLARYRAAFPKEYARWTLANATAGVPSIQR